MAGITANAGPGSWNDSSRLPRPSGRRRVETDKEDWTVEITSKITVNPYASAGKVTAANTNCVEERQVVIKEVGVGKIGAAKTDDKGVWKAQPSYKGEVPFEVYAEVKAVSQGTAGTIYKCLGAKSKTLEISGG